MDIKKLLGARIQELRKSKNITQEYLAELVGIDTVSLSNIERGRYYPTADNLNKILSVLNVEPAELFNFQHLASHKALLEDLKKASQFIYLEYFIIEEGKFWNSILDILKEKEKE